MKNLKIMIVVQHLKPGGIEAMALDFLRSLSVEETLLVSLEGSAKESLSAWPALSAHQDQIRFLGKKPGWDLGVIHKLQKLVSEFRPHIIHSHHIGPMLYGGVVARFNKIPLVHTEHDAWHLEDPKRRRLQSWALRLLKPLVVADAQLVARHYQEALGKAPQKVILNGIDVDRFAPRDRHAARRELGLPEDRFILGVSGRLVEVKRIDLLIQCFALLPQYNLHLAIAGSGPMWDELKLLISDLRQENRISLLGHVEDMPGFYNALDRFVLPSAREGLPLSLLEAQACGVRAIATDVGGNREALCPRTGVLVPGNDIKALNMALSSFHRLATTDGNPREFVTQNGSLQAMFDGYMQAYKEALL